jgi:hypothetical protein
MSRVICSTPFELEQHRLELAGGFFEEGLHGA